MAAKISHVSENEARAWLQGLLIEEAGFAQDEAQRTVSFVFADGATAQLQAMSVAIAARATSRLPGAAAWWSYAGRDYKGALLEGRGLEEVGCWVAETISPAPDGWDPNWPDSKRFNAIDLPEDCRVGDSFIVGDGMGSRGRFRVAERDGQRGAEFMWSWHVLDDERHHVAVEAERFGLWPRWGARRVSYTPEEIVARLHQADRLLSEGVESPQVAEALDVSDETYRRWREHYSGMVAEDVRRSQEVRIEVLENENRLLKIILQHERDRASPPGQDARPAQQDGA